MTRLLDRFNIPAMLASLAGITFLVFFNAIDHPFVHDDVVFIAQNPQIAHLDRLPEVFVKASTGGEGGLNSYYRPILEVFYRLQYALFGLNPAGFHFVNILIHILNGLLIFAILLRLNFNRWMAYAMSLFFLIHPIQTEAVACIAGISNVLSASMILLTIYTYLREKYVLSMICFVVAFLTKEQVVILPLLLILLDGYKQKKQYQWWFVFIVLTIGLLFVRAQITHAHLLEDVFASPGELRLRLLAIPRTILLYLRLLICPFDLHYYRNLDILSANAWGFFALGGLSVVLGGFIKKFQMNGRMIGLGLAWFIICLLPVLNILPIVNEYSLILTAEHFLYLPMLGILIVAGVLIEKFVPQSALVVLMCSIALLGGALSIYQNTFWRSEVALFERMIRFESNFGRGQIILGNAYYLNGQPELAIEHYTQALSIMKGYQAKSVNANATKFYSQFVNDIHFYIARALTAQGKFKESIEYFHKTLKENPKNIVVLEGMALTYLQMREYEQAIDTFNQALSINPQNASLLNNIAIVYLQQGDKVQAEQFFKMALGVDPTYSAARQNLNQLMDSQH